MSTSSLVAGYVLFTGGAACAELAPDLNVYSLKGGESGVPKNTFTIYIVVLTAISLLSTQGTLLYHLPDVLILLDDDEFSWVDYK